MSSWMVEIENAQSSDTYSRRYNCEVIHGLSNTWYKRRAPIDFANRLADQIGGLGSVRINCHVKLSQIVYPQISIPHRDTDRA